MVRFMAPTFWAEDGGELFVRLGMVTLFCMVLGAIAFQLLLVGSRLVLAPQSTPGGWKRWSTVVVLAVALLAACGTPPPGVDTVTVGRGSLQVTVSGSGTVEPAESADLTFGVAGTVEEVAVKEGHVVKKGQFLAGLDVRDLEQQILQADANLEMAEARLEQARVGNATDEDKTAAAAGVDQAKAQLEKVRSGGVTKEDILDAEAVVRNAEAALESARTGNVTPADIENAQAAVRTAEANLQKLRTGNITPADIANAEAAVRSAEAALERARTGNVTAADIENAQAVVRSAEANLQRARTGNVTEADIANAEAAVRSAEAKLQATMAGPSPDQVSPAEARLRQAQQNYQSVSSSASAKKTLAEQGILQAADRVRLAQDTYSAAYWKNEQAQAGIDPESGNRFDDQPVRSGIVDPAVRKQDYANALKTAEIELRQAEGHLEQLKVAYENTKQQEISELAIAQAQVDDAQVQLDELLKGPKETDVTQARSLLDQARAQLEKLQQGGTPADVAAAQAQVDQARAQLKKLRQGGTPADVAAAQAQVDQARAQLKRLRQGGTPADIAAGQGQVDQARAQLKKLRQGGSAADVAAAQAQVDQARAQLLKLQGGGNPADIEVAQAQIIESQAMYEKLTAPATRSDLAIAAAGVRQAQAQLAAAKLERDKSALRSPFTGVITAVNVSPGDSVSGSGADRTAITVIDASQLHIDVSISEADVAQVETGQPAVVTFDALGTAPIQGTISFIASAATTVQNVTTYQARVDLPKDLEAVRVGMSASVEVGVAEKQDILVIPSSAIRTEGNKHFVRMQRDDTFVDTEIRVGLANDLESEVTAGLKAGDRIASIGLAPASTGSAE